LIVTPNKFTHDQWTDLMLNIKYSFFLSVLIFMISVFTHSLSFADLALNEEAFNDAPTEEEVRDAVVKALFDQMKSSDALLKNVDNSKHSKPKSEVSSQKSVVIKRGEQDKQRIDINQAVAEAFLTEMAIKKASSQPRVVTKTIGDSKKRGMTRLLVTIEGKPAASIKKSHKKSHKKLAKKDSLGASSVKNQEEKKVDTSLITAKVFPVGRNKSAIQGWVYLGRFDSGEWENKTLDTGKQLPQVGKYYVIKASRLNVRDDLPQKGGLGKVIHAFQTEEKIKVLKLKRSGRNHDYWAEVLRE